MQSNDPNLVHAQGHLPGQTVQGQVNQGLVNQGLVQGQVNPGLVQGQVVQGNLVDPTHVHGQGHVHTHTHTDSHTHTHGHTHGHHHGNLTADQQVLLQQTGVQTTGMTLVSTQVGQPVVVNQATVSGGQVYTTGLVQPGVGTTHTHTTHTHTHNTAGLVGAGVGTGLVAGAGTGAVVNHNLGNDYKGTFVFRPLEGRFTKDKDIVGKMDPYVKIKIGFHSGKSAVAKSEGVNPVWGDVIPLEKKHHEEFAKLKVKDKDRASLNDKIGETKIPLADIAARGRVNQWFPVYKKEVQTGEILLDIAFEALNRVV